MDDEVRGRPDSLNDLTRTVGRCEALLGRAARAGLSSDAAPLVELRLARSRVDTKLLKLGACVGAVTSARDELEEAHTELARALQRLELRLARSPTARRQPAPRPRLSTDRRSLKRKGNTR